MKRLVHFSKMKGLREMTYTTNEMVLPRNFAMHSEDEMMYLDGGGGYTNTCRYTYRDFNSWGWAMRGLAAVTTGVIYIVGGKAASAVAKEAKKLLKHIGVASTVISFITGSILWSWADTAFDACDKIEEIATAGKDNWNRLVWHNTYWKSGCRLGVTVRQA